MSLKNMLELLLKLGASESELREGIALYDKIAGVNGDKQSKTKEKPPQREKSKPSASQATNGRHSPRVASILPLQDWMTADSAAERLGISPEDVEHIVEAHGLECRPYTHAPCLVHVRQIAYWMEHHRILPVDTSVFDGWVRQEDAAKQNGVQPHKVYYLVQSGRVAAFKPHGRLVLVNDAEVSRAFQKRGRDNR